MSKRIELGLHHEQQHQELMLTDLKALFALNPLKPACRSAGFSEAGERNSHQETPSHQWVALEGGIVEIGAAGGVFAFDNETPRHQALVNPCAISSRLVTNGEFMEFIADDGYKRSDLWLSDAWRRLREEGWDAPLYWERSEDGAWWTYDFSGAKPVRHDEPAYHLSYFEAQAFAAWRQARLPTEVEWEAAVSRQPEAMKQAFGVAWQWTQSAYLPYPGFRPLSGSLGEYNGKFMCNQMVLRGSSFATASGHERVSYRNFFPPEARWQFSGVRLARDL